MYVRKLIKPLLINHYSMYCNDNDATSKSCEQRLITKEYMVMYTNLIVSFYAYSITLVIKLCHVLLAGVVDTRPFTTTFLRIILKICLLTVH